MSRIPRRASRNIWQGLNRWWHGLWFHETIIYFDEVTKEGVMVSWRYPKKKVK